MTIDRMIELLQIEHECMLRGAHGDCERNCEKCDLVQDDGELHEMYIDVIALLKKQEAKPVIITTDTYGTRFYHCPECNRDLHTYPRQLYCSNCGQAVKWE